MSAAPSIEAQGLHGPEIRLRPRGRGRYLALGFLTIWLGGWAVAEAFVIWAVAAGARTFLHAAPVNAPAIGRMRMPNPPGGAVTLFLAVWLIFWTLGGMAAIREWLRAIWSEDRLSVAPDGIAITRIVGPFRSTRRIGRDLLRRIYLLPGRSILMAETPSATIEVSRLGSEEERRSALGLIEAMCGLPDAADAGDSSAIPAGWQEIMTAEGSRAIVPDLMSRRLRARLTAGLTLGAVAATALLIHASRADASLVPLACIAGAASAALASVSLWLSRCTMEWVIGSGRLMLQRRLGDGVRILFEADHLELTESTDSDGDRWCSLRAVAPGAGPTGLADPGRMQRRIDASMRDPARPRRLGAWIARVAGIPLDDRTGTEVRAAEIARLKAQLAGGGRLGRFLSAWIDRVEKRGSPLPKEGGSLR